MKKFGNRKDILKEAGVLLIAALIVLSSIAVTANTTNKEGRTVVIWEGFEDGIMPPAGWTLNDTDSNWGITTEAFSGVYAAKFYDATGSKTAELISPVVNCSAMMEVYLSFWHKQPSMAKGQDALLVNISVDGGAWNTVADYTSDIQRYTHEIIDLSAIAAGAFAVQVKFVATGGGGDGVYLDEIRLCDGYATEFMGLNIVPLGVADLQIVETNLSVSNCTSGQPETDGVWVNLEDTYNQWYCVFKNPEFDDTPPPIGASMKVVGKGVINGTPDQVMGAIELTKLDECEYCLVVDDSEASTYTLEVYLNDSLVYRQENFSFEERACSLVTEWDCTSGIDELTDVHMTGYTVRDSETYEIIEDHREYNISHISGPPSPPKLDILGGPSNLEWDEIRLTPEQIYSHIEVFSGVYMYLEDISSLTTTEMDANTKPNAPTIKGPTSGKAGTKYEYKIIGSDPDDDDPVIWICINWGDDTGVHCYGPYPCGVAVILSHTWDETGMYITETYTKDIQGLKSDLRTLIVTMPKNKAAIFNFNLLEWLLERFPNAFPILRLLLQRLGLQD